jgi:hypothetical protein
MIPSLPFWQFLSQESLTIWWLLLGLSLANHVSARVFLTSWSWQRLAKEWGIRPWAGGYTLFFLSLTASTRKKKNRLQEFCINLYYYFYIVFILGGFHL